MFLQCEPINESTSDEQKASFAALTLQLKATSSPGTPTIPLYTVAPSLKLPNKLCKSASRGLCGSAVRGTTTMHEVSTLVWPLPLCTVPSVTGDAATAYSRYCIFNARMMLQKRINSHCCISY